MRWRTSAVSRSIPRVRRILSGCFAMSMANAIWLIAAWFTCGIWTRPSDNGVELEALERAHAVGTGSVVHLAQALIKTGAAAPPRLWVVTEGARQLNSLPAPIDIAQAPVWGLGKVVALEHPELRCARIDLEAGAAGIQQLFEEVLSDDEEDEIAFRDGVRYVARLAPCSNDGDGFAGR